MAFFTRTTRLAMARLTVGIAFVLAASLPANAWLVNGSGGCTTGGNSSSGVVYGGAAGGFSAWSNAGSVVCGGNWQGGFYVPMMLPFGGMVGVPMGQANPPPLPPEQQPQANMAPIPIGTQVTALPGNCEKVTVQGVDYYQCRPNWFKPHFGNTSVYYQAVQAPY